jgi:hypothetical protein
MKETAGFRLCKITIRVMKIALPQFYPEGQEIEDTSPFRKEGPLLRLIYSPKMTYDGAFEKCFREAAPLCERFLGHG